jgi:hypothetical protein
MVLGRKAVMRSLSPDVSSGVVEGEHMQRWILLLMLPAANAVPAFPQACRVAPLGERGQRVALVVGNNTYLRLTSESSRKSGVRTVTILESESV